MNYTKRYEGIRWKIVFGEYTGVEKHAVNELHKCVQRYLPYVLQVEKAAEGTEVDNCHLLLIGTPDNHPLLSKLVEEERVAQLSENESYNILSFDSPWSEGKKIIALAGFDPSGVLYGVYEFIAQVLNTQILVDHPNKLRESFDTIRPFNILDRPLIDNRGIWSWGYVIYDYRRFLDNMAKLRMNMLTVWNDCVPLNAREFVGYAHSRGIKVIMGFHWGWGIDKLDPNSDEDLQKIKAQVIDNYTQNYAGLGIDGIYFQTFTETQETKAGENSIASLACKWVNEIANGLYAVDPDLYIQFGLHATSIKSNYAEFKALDPRITIVWEDAGAIPYPYSPTDDIRTLGVDVPDFPLKVDETINYSKKLVKFRENTEFALVPKGFNALRWDTDFEHHGDFILGERDPKWIKKRLMEYMPRWECIDALWLKYNTHAASFYREILELNPSKCTATALVEDGMFEEYIPLSVALFAQTVWNPFLSDEELLKKAVTTQKYS